MTEDSFYGWFWGIVASIIIVGCMSCCLYGWGYKSGQVDALTGKVKYQLIENADKTKSWVEKK